MIVDQISQSKASNLVDLPDRSLEFFLNAGIQSALQGPKNLEFVALLHGKQKRKTELSLVRLIELVEPPVLFGGQAIQSSASLLAGRRRTHFRAAS